MFKFADRKVVIVVLAGALTIFIGMGTRSFGLYLAPISQDLGVGREVYSLAIALQNLIFGLPLAGIIADRYGPRWVLLGGGLLYSGGFLLLSFTVNSVGLYLVLGLVMGLAFSSISYVVVLGAVAQVVSPQRRSTAFGVITASGSLGSFALVPGVQWLLSSFGWQRSFILLAAFVTINLFLAFGLPRRTGARTTDSQNDSQDEDSLLQTLQKAGSHPGYLLLTAGFFVCGFHVAFIATHLPAFLTDNGLPKMIGATALSLIGLFNLLGSSLFGFLGDRYRKKYLLSFIYGARAVVFSMFILIPLSNFSALLFGSAIGFLWLATVPLTSGTISQIFGSRYLSTLYGIVFFSHQLGSFLGVWLAGRMYDSTGSYSIVWGLAIALALTSAVLHLPITDKPLQTIPLEKATN